MFLTLTGHAGICCPGGVFTALQYEPWQLNRARSAGHHCGKLGVPGLLSFKMAD